MYKIAKVIVLYIVSYQIAGFILFNQFIYYFMSAERYEEYTKMIVSHPFATRHLLALLLFLLIIEIINRRKYGYIFRGNKYEYLKRESERERYFVEEKKPKKKFKTLLTFASGFGLGFITSRFIYKDKDYELRKLEKKIKERNSVDS